MKFMVFSNSARGNWYKIARRAMGTIIEAPIACKTLDILKVSKSTEKAQHREPVINRLTAIINIDLEPNLSDSQPDNGINKASVSV